MANAKRQCCGCKGRYKTETMIHLPVGWFCSHTCASLYATKRMQEQQEKHARKAKRERRDALKTRSQWLKEAQTAFNRFIRARDMKKPCISCGRFHEGQWHAGHYRTVGAHPELRFTEVNCHKQCAPCNNHKSGNIVEYRIELVKRIGQDQVEWLEGAHDPLKLTIDEIKALKAKYNKKAREAERAHQTVG